MQDILKYFSLSFFYNSLISAYEAKCANLIGSSINGRSGLRILMRNAFLVNIFLLYFSGDSIG